MSQPIPRWMIYGLIGGMALTGCAKEVGNGVDPGKTPSISASVDPQSVTVEQGASVDVTGTITGAGGFTGSAALGVEGAPAGVTATVSNVVTSGAMTTATITIQVGMSVAPGSYTLTARARGTGVSDATVALTLNVTAAPTYDMTLSSSAISVEQGGSGMATVDLARTNFTGGVDLALEGAPTGVTGSFDEDPVTSNASILEIAAGGAVAEGDYTLTVRGTASGLADRTATLTLTVTAPGSGSFSLSMSPATVSVAQSGATSSIININRTGGFSASVSLSVVGVPTGLTATLNPINATGNASTLDISASASLAAGTYTLTVRGAVSGFALETTVVGVTVTASGGNNVSIDFSSCAVAERPIWFAAQSGATWTQVIATNDVYTFAIKSATGGVAFVTEDMGTFDLIVQHMTQAEFTGGMATFCDPEASKTVNGTAAGITAGLGAQISLGGAGTSVFANGAFQLVNVPDGTHDLVGYLRNPASRGTGERMFLRRGQNIASGGSVGTVDFAGAGSFDPASGAMTISGLTGGESIIESMFYFSGTGASGCQQNTLYALSAVTGSSYQAYGAPVAQQVAGDFHATQLLVSGSNGFRMLTEYFQAMGNRTVTLGPDMPVPSIFDDSRAYKQLEASVTYPAEFNTFISFLYSTASNGVGIFATSGAFGGTSIALFLPDFSGVSGWDNSYAPGSGETVEWGLTGTGVSNGGACSDGGRVIFATTSGTN